MERKPLRQDRSLYGNAFRGQTGSSATTPEPMGRMLPCPRRAEQEQGSTRPSGTIRRGVAVAMLLAPCLMAAQQAPRTSSQPWTASASEQAAVAQVSKRPETAIKLGHIYTLPELVDLAELHNPQTRVAWEAAKVRAQDLRVAKSDLLPTLVAVGLANSVRQGVLLYQNWALQDLDIFDPLLRLNYTVLDFGPRLARIRAAREQLAASDFAFNTVQLNLLYETARRYYHLLDMQGQLEAALVALNNANMVRDAVNARLNVGLATLPDALEARAAASQAQFQVEAVRGGVDVASGDLLELLGASPTEPMQVEPLSALTVPDVMDANVQDAIERALKQRPEMGQHVAEERAAQQTIKGARGAYFPTVEFQGEDGKAAAWGSQDNYPTTYAPATQLWNATLSIRWTVFDGFRREAELSRAHEQQKEASAAIDETRDQVEQQVWTAYINLRTAIEQRKAAAALLVSAQASYDAAMKTYGLGLRNVVDVVTAQRTLAQAMSTDVTARTSVLTALVTMSYRTGDLLTTPTSRKVP